MSDRGPDKSTGVATSFAAAMYDRAPRRLVERAVSFLPPMWRLGPSFPRTLSWIRANEYRSAEEWTAYQAKRLLRVLEFAQKTVPYYLRRIRADVERVKAQDVFRFMEDVPFLTRQDIEANFEDLWSTAVPKWRRKLVTTGGTSGAPLKFGLERTSYTTEFAYIADIWRRVGFSPWDKRLTVRGVAIPGDQVVRHRPFTNELQLSAFHLSDHHLSRAWPEVVRFQPAFLFGYPSAITALVKWNPQKVGALGLRAVLCGSEGLYPWQRAFLQEQLGVRVTSWYGHSEKSILGGECEVDTAYHFYPSYGFLEVVDDNGGPVPPDGTGEIVGTQFLSMAMPLIRYRTGDTATREPRSCSCGRRYPLLRDAVGRWGQECLVGHSGAPISSAAINFHDETLFGIEALQFVQSVQGEAELLIQPGPSFPPERLPQIVASLKRKLKDELTVTVRLVPTIQRAPSGKVPIIRRSGRLETP